MIKNSSLIAPTEPIEHKENGCCKKNPILRKEIADTPAINFFY